MAKKQSKKELAEDLFITNGLTAKEISEVCGVSEQSLSRWRKEGEWDKRRDSLLTSPLKIKEVLMTEALRLSKGEESKIDADKLSKVMAAIGRLEKRVSASVVQSVLRELDNWLSETDPQAAVDNVNHHKQFLMYKIRQESGE